MPISPKPKHQTIVGRVRINLFAGVGTERGKPATITLERRRDDQTEDWYPAAGFKVEELGSLEQAARAVQEHLAHPNGRAPAKRATPQPSTHSESVQRTEAAAPAVQPPRPEEPPFTPTRVPISHGSNLPARLMAPPAHPRSKPARRIGSRAKASRLKSRSR